jgi:hypothetical protein
MRLVVARIDLKSIVVKRCMKPGVGGLIGEQTICTTFVDFDLFPHS